MTYVKKPDPVDVCIVGAGATGGTTAKVLAEAGLKVVVLEKGPRMKPENFSGDELKYVNRNYLWPDPKISRGLCERMNKLKRSGSSFPLRRKWSAEVRCIGPDGSRVRWNVTLRCILCMVILRVPTLRIGLSPMMTSNPTSPRWSGSSVSPVLLKQTSMNHGGAKGILLHRCSRHGLGRNSTRGARSSG